MKKLFAAIALSVVSVSAQAWEITKSNEHNGGMFEVVEDAKYGDLAVYLQRYNAAGSGDEVKSILFTVVDGELCSEVKAMGDNDGFTATIAGYKVDMRAGCYDSKVYYGVTYESRNREVLADKLASGAMFTFKGNFFNTGKVENF